jgi:hypothetical protein
MRMRPFGAVSYQLSAVSLSVGVEASVIWRAP